MLVTDDALLAGRPLRPLLEAAVRGGVTSVQLRLKRATAAELVALARELVAALPVPVLVNDRPDVVLAAGAAGVHLGPDDLPPALARRILGPAAVIGASVGTAAEVRAGEAADYWGIGPWRATGTKHDAGDAIGAAGFRTLQQRAGTRPCVAIGGLRPEDVPAALAAGAAGVAVISGILAAPDPERAAATYAELLRRG